MENGMEAVCIFLDHSADFLDDISLDCFLRALGGRIGSESVSFFYESRCFSEGYALKLDDELGMEKRPRLNFSVLWKLNTDSSTSLDANLSYVQIGDLLLSIPVTNIAIPDLIGHIYSTVRRVVERQFILYHMSADGSVGHECIPGQSGSRFIARIFQSSRDETPFSPRTRILSQRLRRYSLQASNPLCLRCSHLPGPATSRGRNALRESSDVNSYRHNIFRSNSLDRVPTCKRSHVSDTTRPKVLSLYFSQGSQLTTEESSSRWSVGGQNPIPVSSVFVFHQPSDFDINKLRLPAISSRTPSGLPDSSPHSTPFARDLTPTLNEIAGRPTNLISMIQDLISRRVLTDGVTVEVPIRNMSAQFDGLFGLGGGSSLRQREELRRLYAPLNAHVVSRAVALTELSRCLSDNKLGELLGLAERQGHKERPLLVQLNQGQWGDLCPRDFRLAAHMLGPTRVSSFPPLPELDQGGPALDRLREEFSMKCLSNTEWSIRIKFDSFTHPIFIPFGSGGAEAARRAGLLQMTADDCRNGFKVIPKEGVIVTKWQGIVAGDSAKTIRIGRWASVEDLKSRFSSSVKLRHGLSWEMMRLNFLNSNNSDTLRNDLHWCASEYLQVSFGNAGEVTVRRSFDDPIPVGESAQSESDKKKLTNGSENVQMLWDQVDRWNSDDTRNVLSQWAFSGDTESSAVSPTARRRRLMAKAVSGGPVDRQEVEELGVDFYTEYSRWWISDDEESETNRISSPRRVRLNLPPPQIEVDILREETPPLRSPIPARPKTPVSPLSRSRRQSSINIEQEPRVLRSTRDTRQFEFHPFDPNLILTGSRSGLISLIDSDKDMALMQTRVDSSPILGLSWLRAHMNVALYGASSSGIVGVVKLGHTTMDYQPIGRFQNLSSVSINCSDDYFIVSGFSRDVSLFDMISGKKVSEFKEIHSNFINITRFANFSPHMLATSSFDSTCKLWDLRRPPTSAVASFTTSTLNVMCCFSPMDDNLLVSGLDANVVQLSVRKGLTPNLSPEILAASIPSRNSSSNYRRAVYTSDGTRFITSGTDENFMRVIDATSGASRGLCRFDGLLDVFEERLNGYKPIKQHESGEQAPVESGQPTSSSSNVRATEYVQSLRGHPIFSKEVGVLLYPFDRSRSSFICTTQIPQSSSPPSP